MLTALKRDKLVAIFRKVPNAAAIETAKAVVRGGINFIEITMDAPNADLQIKEVSSYFKGEDVFVGAGTVLSVEMAKKAIEAGAQFLVSPNLDEAVVKYCQTQNIPMFPGVLTPTEAERANQLGCSFVKIFPAGSMGASYIKNLKGPLSHIDFMATGGVNLDNIQSFIKNGAAAIGLGSQLVDLNKINDGNFESIESVAKQYRELAKGVSND
ncbi:MAG: bifunctional 4-hydroxy-2-oxoglutarate aldolase/2-dehydro-3-deoxy-phosphogluconate aldolase [Amphibacillus sp.]|uniref:Putative 2-keto-4-hydroxyglutarate aldolase/2-keto-3-deoxy-6-phosphogluconate aldolase n=1 Tax=Amphibacillus xylanus (strain ATCC 51415 / DSM 6626 / JCM 7361 / LMG 17667 / NBRC 15112 / Ep01) TaxID=698758 RepID=K0IZL3_AMPXN|nr:bifunctional 4-hydroxy-2-oxoglutarate aldolase/2-dehydro-3-deoxy-phosphogluconate aldolase [Amphibacillus xylanus]NMA90165.1 bifunctional 4-hydroxy-2-oxoglutarate aldolase/2-dehydro-3-deoxy-phosphogluconate aldolase [Amphibacillus sp.]BAM46407.1 putative 2-keto-4-hydroxyglutarate aldolase/2-keto-3-deoxy-6-phosphogluconate aldolase [Amphibacillus xylanus NBRC 15112]